MNGKEVMSFQDLHAGDCSISRDVNAEKLCYYYDKLLSKKQVSFVASLNYESQSRPYPHCLQVYRKHST